MIKSKSIREYIDNREEDRRFYELRHIPVDLHQLTWIATTAESDARKRAVKAFKSALSMFAQGSITQYEAYLIFQDKYDNE